MLRDETVQNPDNEMLLINALAIDMEWEDSFDSKDTTGADFSNISNTILYVSDALHKANIDFTEKGIKAAAVTVIVMADKSMVATPTKPKEIKIDKPFLYMTRDKNTGEIWFVGTVYEPNYWENDKLDYQYR